MRFSANATSVADAHRKGMNLSVALLFEIVRNTRTLVLFQTPKEVSIARKMLEHGIFLAAEGMAMLGITFAQPFNASSDSGFLEWQRTSALRITGRLVFSQSKGPNGGPCSRQSAASNITIDTEHMRMPTGRPREKKNAGAPTTPVSRLRAADVVSVPRYWVSRDDAILKGCGGPSCWQLLYRFSAYPDNERTMISWCIHRMFVYAHHSSDNFAHRRSEA